MDRHADGVHNPAEEDIDGVPDAVSFAQLFWVEWLAPGWAIVHIHGFKDMVNSDDQGFADASGLGCLSKQHKNFKKYI